MVKFVIERSSNQETVWLVELSVSFERNNEQALTRYEYLEDDSRNNGFIRKNISSEVESRDKLTLSNRLHLSTLNKLSRTKMKLKALLQSRQYPKYTCYALAQFTTLEEKV